VLQLPPSFPGCLVTVRLIGVLHAEQHEGGRRIRNDRLIGVADTPVNPARLKELSALDEEELRAIEHFLRSYNAFQGREFDIKGRGDSREAMRVLDRAIDAHSAHGS
jgi:inorganic pyrophosphatase